MRSKTLDQTLFYPVLENMNDLNAPPCRLPTPDILQNVPGGSNAGVGRRRRTNPNQTFETPAQEKRPVVFDDGRVCGCRACKKLQKPKLKGQRRITRGLCCFGWIFCCPIFTMAWALRTAPIDKQDLQEDDCYPCYGSSQ